MIYFLIGAKNNTTAARALTLETLPIGHAAAEICLLLWNLDMVRQNVPRQLITALTTG
jgi:hypothetical protein